MKPKKDNFKVNSLIQEYGKPTCCIKQVVGRNDKVAAAVFYNYDYVKWLQKELIETREKIADVLKHEYD